MDFSATSYYWYNKLLPLLFTGADPGIFIGGGGGGPTFK